MTSGRFVIVRVRDEALMESCAYGTRWTQRLDLAKVFRTLEEAQEVAVYGEVVRELRDLVAKGRLGPRRMT